MSGVGVRVVTSYNKPILVDEAGFEPARLRLQRNALPIGAIRPFVCYEY